MEAAGGTESCGAGASHGLFNCPSVAELLPGKGPLFFLLGSAVILGHESCPFWPPVSILIEVPIY